MSTIRSSRITTSSSFKDVSSSRLQSLYSDFTRQKISNPTSYNANVEWWRRNLETMLWDGLLDSPPLEGAMNSSGVAGNRLILCANRSLLDNMKLEGVGKPIGLGAVITELLASSAPGSKVPVLIPVSSFHTLSKSIYVSNSTSITGLLATYLISKPFWWSLEQIGIIGDYGLLPSSSTPTHATTSWHGNYLVFPLVERAAEAILMQLEQESTGAADSLFTMDQFRRKFANCVGSSPADVMSEADAKVLVRFLQRDKSALVVSKDAIKFVGPDEDAEITAVDTGILELKTAVENLHAQVDGIHRRIDQLTEKAGAALKQKRKSLALNYLRSRKELENLLVKRLSSLDNLESTLLRVEAAAEDVKIVETFQSSTATLRSILSHPSLERGSVERTMEALADANADAKEIDDTIRIGGDVAVGIDDDDLEEELAGLVAESQREEQEDKEVEEIRRRLDGLSPTEEGVLQSQPEKEKLPVLAA